MTPRSVYKSAIIDKFITDPGFTISLKDKAV